MAEFMVKRMAHFMAEFVAKRMAQCVAKRAARSKRSPWQNSTNWNRH
jgi:hypothetical protein